MERNDYATIFALALAMFGCRGFDGRSGGTQGIVHMNGSPLAGVQVLVFRHGDESPSPLGQAVTGEDGRFALTRSNSSWSLWLSPGEYAFTIRAAGEIHMSWPSEFGDPEQTPLRKKISSKQEAVELEVPAPMISHHQEENAVVPGLVQNNALSASRG